MRKNKAYKFTSPILIDCDGVIADFMQHAINIANASGKCSKAWGKSEIYQDVRQFPLWKEAGLEEQWKSPGFCSNIPVIPGSQDFVNEVRDMGFRVVFVTSPPRDNITWPYERRQWLEKHFDAKRSDVIFAVDKRFINGALFLDDHVGNVLDWQEYQQKQGAILIAQPWNKNVLTECEHRDGHVYKHLKKNQIIHRTNDWEEILDEVYGLIQLLEDGNYRSETQETSSKEEATKEKAV